MKLLLYFIGKNKDSYLKQELDKFLKRTKSYCSVDYLEIEDVKQAKNLSPEQLKLAEAEKFRKQLKATDRVFLLDEKGKSYSSRIFAAFIENEMNTNPGRLILCVGGAYGWNDDFKKAASGLISLSDLTMNHQIVRLVLVEQVYRAFAILNNHPYHND